jgi:hypothetical protein
MHTRATSGGTLVDDQRAGGPCETSRLQKTHTRSSHLHAACYLNWRERETLMSMPRPIIIVSTLLPPDEKNGSVMPDTGTS